MAPKARKGGGASSSAAASASSEASVDRKLKSVYEMIDSRNYKGALKQLAVILQKSKDNAHVLVRRTAPTGGAPAVHHKGGGVPVRKGQGT